MLRVGDVARYGDDAVEARDGALERLTVARVDRHPPAALGQRTRECEPEPARCAGDDCPLHASTGTPWPATTRS